MNTLEQFLSQRDARAGDFLVTNKGKWTLLNSSYVTEVTGANGAQFYHINSMLVNIGKPIALYRPDWELGIKADLWNSAKSRHGLFFTELKPKENLLSPIRDISVCHNTKGFAESVTINGVKFVREK